MEPVNLLTNTELTAAIAGLNFVRTVQRCAGVMPYDKPVVSEDRLYFRINYQRGIDAGWSRWAATGDWSAYIVALTAMGSFEVVLSRLPERSAVRSESSRVVFTALSDAIKFIMVNVLDSVRTKYDLDSLFVRFRNAGTTNELWKSKPTPSEAAIIIARLAPKRSDLTDMLQRISLRSDPTRAGIGFREVEPYMKVLTLSIAELQTALVAKLPEHVTECIDTFAVDYTDGRSDSAQFIKLEGDAS